MLNFTSECNVWLHIPKRNNWPLFQLYFHALVTGIAIYPAAMLSNSLYHGNNNGRAKDERKTHRLLLWSQHRPATFCLSLSSCLSTCECTLPLCLLAHLISICSSPTCGDTGPALHHILPSLFMVASFSSLSVNSFPVVSKLPGALLYFRFLQPLKFSPQFAVHINTLNWLPVFRLASESASPNTEQGGHSNRIVSSTFISIRHKNVPLCLI